MTVNKDLKKQIQISIIFLLVLTAMIVGEMLIERKIVVTVSFNLDNKYSKITDMKTEDTNLITVIPYEDSKPEPTPIPIIIEKYIVNASILNIREEPSISSKKVSEYYRGQIIEVYGKDDAGGKWLKTKDGYISADYVLSLQQHNDRIKKYTVSRGSSPMSLLGANGSIISKSNLTLDEVRTLLSGTGMEGIEEAIIDIEEKEGINCFFTISVGKLESGNGNSQIARDKNNLFGLNASDDNPYKNAFSFRTKSESVYKFGEIIKSYYVNQGLTTLDRINAKYCSSPDWASKVYNIMKADYNKVKR